MPRRLLLALIAAFPLAATAASGSWSGYSVGGIVSVGRQTADPRPARRRPGAYDFVAGSAADAAAVGAER